MNQSQPHPYGIPLSTWLTIPLAILELTWAATSVIVTVDALAGRWSSVHAVWVVTTAAVGVYAPVWFMGVAIAENVL